MSEKLLSNNKTNIARLEKEVSLWLLASILLSILKDLKVLLIFFEVKLFPKFLQIILRLKIKIYSKLKWILSVHLVY
jgi:hypothetical protein